MMCSRSKVKTVYPDRFIKSLYSSRNSKTDEEEDSKPKSDFANQYQSLSKLGKEGKIVLNPTPISHIRIQNNNSCYQTLNVKPNN